ncbi:Sec63 complex subunit [Martiniozyma asiatica (nom. inval.)]|nr:Sec63 complex subunit [Martiniozyma asiatica]
MDSISVVTPLVYLAVLIGLLVAFSIYHRRNTVASLQQLTSTPLFFPSVYEEGDSTASIIHESVLALQREGKLPDQPRQKLTQATLIYKLAETLRRLHKLRETQPSMASLYTRGLVGDATYQHFKLQMKLEDLAVQEILREACHWDWKSILRGPKGEVLPNINVDPRMIAQILMPIGENAMMNLALRRRTGAIATAAEGRTYLKDTLSDGLAQQFRAQRASVLK